MESSAPRTFEQFIYRSREFTLTSHTEPINMPSPIRIVEYDPDWSLKFEAEKNRIIAAVGGRISTLVHMGSTAVPGLCAKPIVDIMAGVSGLGEAEALLPALAEFGYDDVSKIEDNDEWFYCLGRAPDEPSETMKYFHLHLMCEDSDEWKRHVDFRDYLRLHPDTAADYCTLKRSLAEKFRNQREEYTESKTPFIREVEAKAAAEL